MKDIAGSYPCVVLGDFNTTPEEQMYKRLTSTTNAWYVDKGLYQFALTDMAAGKRDTASYKTFPSKSKDLDYCFAFNKVSCSKYRVIPSTRKTYKADDGQDYKYTDHNSIYYELKFTGSTAKKTVSSKLTPSYYNCG